MTTNTLKIKMAAVTRLQKDLKLYTMELQENEKALETLKGQEDVDGYKVKNSTRLVDESARMITAAQAKYDESVSDLKTYLDSITSSSSSDAEHVQEARKLLAEQ